MQNDAKKAQFVPVENEIKTLIFWRSARKKMIKLYKIHKNTKRNMKVLTKSTIGDKL